MKILSFKIQTSFLLLAALYCITDKTLALLMAASPPLSGLAAPRLLAASCLVAC